MADILTLAAATVAQAEALLHGGRVLDGVQMAQAVLAEAERSGDLLQQADAHRVLSVGHHYAGQMRESLLSGYRAIELFEAAGEAPMLARVLSLTAIALARVGDTGGALALLTRSLDLLKQLDDPATEARVWNNMSVVHESIGEFAKAISTVERAIACAERVGDTTMRSHLHANLLLFRMKHGLRLIERAPAEGRAALDEALAGVQAHSAQCEAMGWHHLVGALADGAGEALIKLDRAQEACGLLRDGLAAAERAGQNAERARPMLTLGIALAAAGQPEAALQHLTEGLALAQQGADQELIGRGHRALSELHEARGDCAEALRCFKAYFQQHDTMLRAQADTRAQVLAVRLDAERERLEAELLRLRTAELERNVHALRSETQQLARDAREDPLTGLANRRGFQRWAEARPDTQPPVPLTLVLADIDHFKRINDSFSHAMGDRVLQAMGALLREHCRPQDQVARFGGEEFVLALAGADAAAAHAVAERLRRAVERHPWAALQPGLAVTISMGLAACRPGETTDATLARADAALYEAKDGGRNQVRRAP